MEYDIKQRIDFHRKAFIRESAASVSRLAVVVIVIGFVFWGRLDIFIVSLMVLYGAVTAFGVRKKMRRERKYYNFEPGNPAFDYLREISETGNPDDILNEINAQIKEGKITYKALGRRNKAEPETIITEGWFIHLHKGAIIIPLDKIVCAYIYDNVTKETPDARIRPSYFKPFFFVITYGKGREAVIRHSNIQYESVLDALDKRLNCRISYTRELGTLYVTDYEAFLNSLKEIIKSKNPRQMTGD